MSNRYKKISMSKDLSTKTKAELKSVFGYEPVSAPVDAASSETDVPSSSTKKKRKKDRKKSKSDDES